MRTAASGARLATPATCRRAGPRRARHGRDDYLKGKTKQVGKPTVEDDLRAELVDQRAKMIAARRGRRNARATTSEAAEAAAKREAAEAERTRGTTRRRPSVRRRR